MEELDKWAVSEFNKLVAKVRDAYERYEYHIIYHGVHNFCAVEMSSFYLDVIKDRLYCDAEDSRSRRSAQSAIFLILDGLVRLLAPILAFTAEEIWAAMPHRAGDDPESVLFNDMPDFNPEYVLPAERQAKWDKLLALRDDVNKALELARAGKVIGKPLDAEITLYLDEEGAAQFEDIRDFNLSQLFIVSKVTVAEGKGEGYAAQEFKGAVVAVRASAAPKCVRCWTHHDQVGQDPKHPELCPRCAEAVARMGL